MKKIVYKTIDGVVQAEIKEKNSRFIAFAYPVHCVEEVKKYVESLKVEHKKARHWCYAYRLDVDGLLFRANDDGEPSGSAGRPILGQIDSFELTNLLIVVVRYFGGTLLGVPGLIHAYKTAARESLLCAKIIEKKVEKQLSLQFEYQHLSEVMRILKLHSGKVISQDLQVDCQLIVLIPLESYEVVVSLWESTRAISVKQGLY